MQSQWFIATLISCIGFFKITFGAPNVLVRSTNGDPDSICFAEAVIVNETYWKLNFQNDAGEVLEENHSFPELVRETGNMEFQFLSKDQQVRQAIPRDLVSRDKEWIPATFVNVKSDSPSTVSIVFKNNIWLRQYKGKKIQLNGFQTTDGSLMVAMNNVDQQKLVALFVEDVWPMFELTIDGRIMLTVMVELKNLPKVELSVNNGAADQQQNTYSVVFLKYWEVSVQGKQVSTFSNGAQQKIISKKCHIRFSSDKPYTAVGEIRYIYGQDIVKLWVQKVWFDTYYAEGSLSVGVFESNSFSVAKRKKDKKKPTKSTDKQWIQLAYDTSTTVGANHVSNQVLIACSFGKPKILAYGKTGVPMQPVFFNYSNSQLTIISRDLPYFESRRVSAKLIAKVAGESSSSSSDQGMDIELKDLEDSQANLNIPGKIEGEGPKIISAMIPFSAEANLGKNNPFGFPIVQFIVDVKQPDGLTLAV